MADSTVDPARAAPTRGPRGHFPKGDLNPKRLKPTESGIQKGTKHRATIIREGLLDAYHTLGAGKYILRLARSKRKEDRAVFHELLKKAMPQGVELSGPEGGAIPLEILALAKIGIKNMSDEDLEAMRTLFRKAGVGDVRQLASANDEESAIHEIPAPAKTAEGGGGA